MARQSVGSVPVRSGFGGVITRKILLPFPFRLRARKAISWNRNVGSADMKVLRILMLAVLWLNIAASGFAQSSPLDIACDRMFPVRSEGPISILVKMTPLTSTIIEGQLEFRLFNGKELLYTMVSEAEVVNPPSKTSRYVLPAPKIHGYVQQLDLEVDFVNSQSRLRYGPFPIQVPLPNERDLIIGTVVPETSTRLPPEVDKFVDSLKLERMSPLENDKSLKTILTQIPPGRLPPDAISYCNFDILFIGAEGFTAMKESQWPPILEWVAAGGSLCLMPTDNLSPHHIVFLNKLLEKQTPRDPFLLGPENELMTREGVSKKATYPIRRGLGRISLVPLDLKASLINEGSVEWKEMQAHLWKFRSDQRNLLMTDGKWGMAVLQKQEDLLKQSGQNYYYQNIRGDHRRLVYLPINSGDQLIQKIVPSNLRIIPLPLIGFILLLYVLAIGPGDYLILGRLKMRKWTWVTFPVITLVFSGGALWMAEWYMNTGDSRRSAVFVDVGHDGQINRVNRFEMLFNSRQKIVETPLTRSLFAPLDHQMYGASSLHTYQQSQYGPNREFVGSAEITGRVPGNFTARQQTPKWVPQLNRIMSFQTEPYAVKLDWQKFKVNANTDWNTRVKEPGWKDEIIKQIRGEFGSQLVQIGVFNGGHYFDVYGTNRIFRPDNHDQYNASQRVYYNSYQNNQSDFLTDVCCPQDGGLFGIITAMSPHGGRQLEDLAMHDPSDVNQWLLIVGIERDGNIIIYRKLFSGTD